jgi:putative transposase
VLKLREAYPRWGKEKIAVLLQRQGMSLSLCMVGRILKALKDKRTLQEPLPNFISVRKRQWKRPYAVRKTKDYKATDPGDIVEVDTLDIRPLPGLILKQFTARDIVSRWDVIKASCSAIASSAADFIATLIDRMPFPIKSIQVDGGSEFQDVFEETSRSVALTCLYCHHDHQNSTATLNGFNVHIPRNSTKSPTRHLR